MSEIVRPSIPVSDKELDDLEARALAASRKPQGDMWSQDHGCIIAYHYDSGLKRGEKIALFMPGDNALWGASPDPAKQGTYSRHVIGASPRTVLRLVNDLRKLKARPSIDWSSEPKFDWNNTDGEARQAHVERQERWALDQINKLRPVRIDQLEPT